jgi:hypothetical protein
MLFNVSRKSHAIAFDAVQASGDRNSSEPTFEGTLIFELTQFGKGFDPGLLQHIASRIGLSHVSQTNGVEFGRIPVVQF